MTGPNEHLDPRLVFHDAADVVDGAVPDPRWVVPDLIAPGAVTTIGGFIGAGKSPFARRMVASILHGQPFLGMPTSPQFSYSAVYLSEEPRVSFKMDAHRAHLRADDPFKVVWFDEAVGAPWDAIVGQATEMLGGNGLLIVDTAYRWAQHYAQNGENDAGVMSEVYAPLVAATRTGVSVLAMAHTVKTFDRMPDEDAELDVIRGSGAVIAGSDVIVLYKKLANAPGSSTRFLKVARSRLSVELPPNRYVTMEDDGTLTAKSGLALYIERQDNLTARVLQHVAAHRDKTQTELRLAWAGRKSDFDATVRLAINDNVIRRTGAGKAGNPYLLEVLS